MAASHSTSSAQQHVWGPLSRHAPRPVMPLHRGKGQALFLVGVRNMIFHVAFLCDTSSRLQACVNTCSAQVLKSYLCASVAATSLHWHEHMLLRAPGTATSTLAPSTRRPLRACSPTQSTTTCTVRAHTYLPLYFTPSQAQHAVKRLTTKHCMAVLSTLRHRTVLS